MLGTIVAITKRIVLQHTTGAYSGLFQILGTDDQLSEKFTVGSLPEFIADVDFIDHKGSCSLIKVKPRYVLYREVFTPSYSFNPEQQ